MSRGARRTSSGIASYCRVCASSISESALWMSRGARRTSSGIASYCGRPATHAHAYTHTQLLLSTFSAFPKDE